MAYNDDVTGPDCAFMYNLINIHTDNVSSIQNNLDGRAGADCVVICNIINTSSIDTHTHTHKSSSSI